jgi:hypothetical protein
MAYQLLALGSGQNHWRLRRGAGEDLRSTNSVGDIRTLQLALHIGVQATWDLQMTTNKIILYQVWASDTMIAEYGCDPCLT